VLNVQYMEKLDENFLALSGHHLYSGGIETPSQNYSARVAEWHELFEEWSAMEMKHREFLAKSIAGMKLIGEGTFRNSDEKRDESVRYVLGLR